MKQNITEEQWNEISGKNKIKFDPIIADDIDGIYIFDDDTNYLLKENYPSIGHMIDFLQKEHSVKCVQWKDEYKHWRVGLDWVNGDDFVYVCEQKELCDALWKAVKYKLKQYDSKRACQNLLNRTHAHNTSQDDWQDIPR